MISAKTQSFCGFENDDMCGFTQETEKDQFDWTRSKGETPSSNTGPSGDHTCRAKGAGKKCGDLLLSDEYGVIHSFGKTNFFYFSLCPRSEIPLFPISIPSFVYDLFEVSIRQISLPLKNATQYFKITCIKFFQKYQ